MACNESLVLPSVVCAAFDCSFSNRGSNEARQMGGGVLHVVCGLRLSAQVVQCGVVLSLCYGTDQTVALYMQLAREV